MAKITELVKRNVHVAVMLLPILSFVPAFLILYYLYGWTFEQTFHGRTFLLIFLWLAALETILSWEKLRGNMISKLWSMRTVLFAVALLLPTLYVVAANYYGWNTMITNVTSGYISSMRMDATQKMILADQMTISIEFLVFAVAFCFIILAMYGISTLADFSISILFLGIFGLLFVIDPLYPGFTPLQILVPITTTVAGRVLTLMGYQVSLFFGSSMPLLVARNASGSFGANIDWVCAGVESLLIYTLMILLFLRKTTIPWKYRIGYFAIGAVVTYFINIWRIANLFVLGIEYGASSVEWQSFHNYYAMLYSISWIACYPLIIIGSQTLWGKIRDRRIHAKKVVNLPI
jgi:exosortase/archaeosortase family protein